MNAACFVLKLWKEILLMSLLQIKEAFMHFMLPSGKVLSHLPAFPSPLCEYSNLPYETHNLNCCVLGQTIHQREILWRVSSHRFSSLVVSNQFLSAYGRSARQVRTSSG